MKRHPSLASLSRDHHRALVLARDVRRALPDASALVADVRRRFARELEPHFAIEERGGTGGSKTIYVRALD